MESTKILAIKPLGFPWETKDPFLFCAHHRDIFPKGNGELGIAKDELIGRNIGQDFTVKNGFRMYHGQDIPGFPYHPHRGFETVTINKEGFVDHSDSLGAAGRFGAGDVQWMTAGKGVQHSEMFPLLNEDNSNPVEIFQIWLNLPKANKFVEPHFKMLWKEDIPVIEEKDDDGRTAKIEVIAGKFNNTQAIPPTPHSWANDPHNDVTILTIKMDANARLTLPKSLIKEVNRTIYFYRGESITIDEEKIEEYHLIELNPTEEVTLVNGNADSYLLFLQGKPIQEPVAQYGPFVMNTSQEIEEAFSDYRRTQFGGWPWPKQEQVHSKDRGRFALHADGREELK